MCLQMMEWLSKYRMEIQLIISVLLIIFGMVMLMMGFWVAPVGVINNSVLIAFGEICTFAGALIGIDYSYKFKTLKYKNKDVEEDEE